MALPKLETKTYTLTLPSTGEEIKYRPFLVKEQKTLLMAQESNDDKEANIDSIDDAVGIYNRFVSKISWCKSMRCSRREQVLQLTALRSEFLPSEKFSTTLSLLLRNLARRLLPTQISKVSSTLLDFLKEVFWPDTSLKNVKCQVKSEIF